MVISKEGDVKKGKVCYAFLGGEIYGVSGIYDVSQSTLWIYPDNVEPINALG